MQTIEQTLQAIRAQREALHGAPMSTPIVAPAPSPLEPAQTSSPPPIAESLGQAVGRALDAYGLRRTLCAVKWSVVIGASLALGARMGTTYPIQYVDRPRVEYIRDTVEVCRYPGKILESMGVRPSK